MNLERLKATIDVWSSIQLRRSEWSDFFMARVRASSAVHRDRQGQRPGMP